MGKEANMAALGKFAEAVNQGKFELFPEAVAAECVDHDPAPGQGPGPEGYHKFFSELREAFPDLSVAPVTVVADEESLAFAYSMTGTHRGVLMGIAPTGKKVSIRGMQIFEVPRWQDGGTLGKLRSAGNAAAIGGYAVAEGMSSNHFGVYLSLSNRGLSVMPRTYSFAMITIAITFHSLARWSKS